MATNVRNTETDEWELYSTNAGKMETTGLETTVQFIPSEKFNLQVSGIYQNTINLTPGFTDIEAAYSPKLLLYGNFTYYFTPDIKLSALYRYIDRMETEWLSETTPENGSRIGSPTKAISIVDLNIRYDNLAFTGTYINLKINNILDTEIKYPTTRSNQWMNLGSHGPGRTIMLSLGYRF